jgi:hypothetical protein
MRVARLVVIVAVIGTGGWWLLWNSRARWRGGKRPALRRRNRTNQPVKLPSRLRRSKRPAIRLHEI